MVTYSWDPNYGGGLNYGGGSENFFGKLKWGGYNKMGGLENRRPNAKWGGGCNKKGGSELTLISKL